MDRVSLIAIRSHAGQVTTTLAVLVSIRSVRSRRPVPVETLRQFFGLTLAEAEVIACLAQGTSIEDVARKRGRKRVTIRNQQHAAYAKIGVKTQAELVACVAEMSPRLSSPGRPGARGATK